MYEEFAGRSCTRAVTKKSSLLVGVSKIRWAPECCRRTMVTLFRIKQTSISVSKTSSISVRSYWDEELPRPFASAAM